MRRKGRDAGDGALLPGYADLQEIGGGAFASVFRAVEVETGRPVALKILKLDTVHAHLIETFHREIQALAAVSDHPNIVTLYRPATTSDGRPVLVLELCRESLAQRLRESGPVPTPEATRIGIKIAGALETAHRNGFLHRDMKPQNILTTQFGEPALADFGVAALQASAQMTAGVFGFTTLHAAPEMLEGHHLSPATDVYGLASTMYQLLTGQAPFAAFEHEAPAAVILRILRDPVRPLRREDIPLDLADLLEAALDKKPEGRPRSAADFAAALAAVEKAQGWQETSFAAWGEEGPEPASVPPRRGPMGVMTVPPLLPPSRPAPPAPPLPPVRPAVAEPEAGRRNVLGPVEAVGRAGPPPAVPPLQARRPPPPVAQATPEQAERPIFVDPEPAGEELPPVAAPSPPPRAGVPGLRPTKPAPVYGPWSVAAIAVAVLVIIAAALVVAGVI